MQYDIALLCVFCSQRQQVSKVFSFHLLYVSSVAYISEEINLGPWWCNKVKQKSQNATFLSLRPGGGVLSGKVGTGRCDPDRVPFSASQVYQ